MRRSHRYEHLRRWWPLMGLAVLLVLLGGWRLLQAQGEINQLRAELAALEAQRAALASQLQAQEERVRELESAALEDRAPRPAQWSVDALDYQPRMAELARHAREAGFEPGTTSWRPSRLELPGEFTRQGSTWQSPGALVSGMVNALSLSDLLGQDVWEVTLRVLMSGPNEATGMIMVWGFQDDSVAGRDYRLLLRQEQGRWYVVDAQERDHCVRGVTRECDLCI
ncbi:MAG: hypothetical protein AB1445_13820 [Bacillota bacterium]